MKTCTAHKSTYNAGTGRPTNSWKSQGTLWKSTNNHELINLPDNNILLKLVPPRLLLALLLLLLLALLAPCLPLPSEERPRHLQALPLSPLNRLLCSLPKTRLEKEKNLKRKTRAKLLNPRRMFSQKERTLNQPLSLPRKNKAVADEDLTRMNTMMGTRKYLDEV